MTKEKKCTTLSPDDAATKIQSLFRGSLIRKKYKITDLSSANQTRYEVLIAGNDPDISNLPRHNDEEIALIATSGLRAVEVATQLTTGIPKIIIIDNSKNVVEFWRMLRDVVRENPENAGTKKELSKKDFFSLVVDKLYSKHYSRAKAIHRDMFYIKHLIQNLGFDKFKQIISKSTILAQTWADEDIFIKLKNILEHNQIKTIYAYPSNLVPYVYEENRAIAIQILNNIKLLNPTLAIHTDIVDSIRPPLVFKTSNHEPRIVAEALKLSLPTKDNSSVQPRSVEYRTNRMFFSPRQLDTSQEKSSSQKCLVM